MSRERPWPYDNLPELYCSSGVTRTSNSRGIGCLMQKLLASCFNCVLFDKKRAHSAINLVLFTLVYPFGLNKQKRMVKQKPQQIRNLFSIPSSSLQRSLVY